MVKKIIQLLMVVIIAPALWGQNESDVLRYSTTGVFGSARFEAMAGAFGALGADMSVAQINPAGLGRYSRSDAAISFNNTTVSTVGNFNGTSTRAQENSFVINNAGIVITTDLSGENRGRKYGQFSLIYNRLKNFNQTEQYEGQNFYSLLDVFAQMGSGISPDFIYNSRPFTTGLAYDVFALDHNASSGEYESRLTSGDMYHNRKTTKDGNMGEFTIGYSENYMNQLYYGLNIGFRSVNYNESYNHQERLLDTTGVSLRSFNYLYEQQTQGLGVNLKLGMLYLPDHKWRFGFAYESPTIMALTDEWSSDMTAMHQDGLKEIESQYVPTGEFSYQIRTPMKIRGSAAYIIGMRGAINVDLELARFGRGLLRSEDPGMVGAYNFSVENQEVDNQFRTVLNTRIGLEYMIIPDFYIRGGYALLPQPYEPDVGHTMRPNQTYAMGLGWENEHIRLDLSYRNVQRDYDFYAFDPSKSENKTTYSSVTHNVVVSFSLKM
ncbi:MAG: OmpP1/FadL family transporter [Bacteroidota bacterium]